MMKVDPYLFFTGNCEQAVEYYKKHLGAKVNMMSRYKDGPKPEPGQANDCPPIANPDYIMHANFNIGDSLIMASDDPMTKESGTRGFALSLALDTAAEADRAFAALSDGGKVTMPMTSTFFADKFGMVQDQFGVHWMIIVQPK